MSTEENKRVVRRYFEEFHNQRRLAIAGEIMTSELSEHTLGLAPMMTAAFPDYQITIVDQIAEGDKVATVWKARGTHQGTWMSPMGPIPPSGKPVSWSGTTTLRLRDGLIDHVIGTNWDHLGILQGMGVVAAADPRPGG